MKPRARPLERRGGRSLVVARSSGAKRAVRVGKGSAAKASQGGKRAAKEAVVGAKKPRTRRSASEARLRILEAAQRQLMRVGPEALRLTDLARQLQVSHPAILHHFGSREGLVAAVVRHSLKGLYEQLLSALRGGTGGSERLELIEMVAQVCGQGGLARLLAWLLLSGRDSKVSASADQPLKQLAEAAHALRRRFGHPASYDDTLFEVQLLAIVLLGEAIFGDAVYGASGGAPGAVAAHDFRGRLTRLLPP